MKTSCFIFFALLTISLFAQNQNDFEFTTTEINGNQSIIITKYIGNNVNVKLPEYINGIRVTAIGERAFEQSNIKTIEISNSVISIGMRAFSGCQELTTVLFSASVTNLGRDASIRTGTNANQRLEAADINGQTAIRHIDNVSGSGGQLGNYGLDLIFDGCSKLTAINVDPNNPTYYSNDGVLFNKQMTVLLFYPHGKEGNYYIPDSVLEITEGAFFNCKQLTSVFFSENIKKIGMFNFFFCPLITSFNVDANNKIFTSENGVLHNYYNDNISPRFPPENLTYKRKRDRKSVKDFTLFPC